MSEQEDPAKLHIHAEEGSTAVGRLYVRDILNGNVVVGNDNIINVYKYSEEETPLSGDEIENGLKRLNEILPVRAPILQDLFATIAKRLRATLGADIQELSPALKRQREEQLDVVQLMCMEVTDITFRALCHGKNPPPYDPRSPFRGLESFRPEDSEFFFGRETLASRLVKRLSAERFLAVLGASGSGKSSLVMAGLIPILGVKYAVFRPGTNSLELLEAARAHPLIVVDQFEELFTLIKDEKIRREFIAKLLETTDRNMVVVTMRADFLGEVSEYPTLSKQIQSHLEIISPMNADELRCAMEEQAKKMELRFEADLSQQMLEDVEGEPGAMPLLQHTLWELWKRRHGYHLRASEYRAFGGVKKAITRTAEVVYDECTSPEQEQIRDIFLRLTRPDDSTGGRDTRRRIPISDLIPPGQGLNGLTLLLNKLTAARLIVTDDTGTEMEVAHEALIRYWDRLRTWININRSNLLFYEQLRDDASDWDHSGRDESYLYRDKRLTEAQQWAKANLAMMRPLEKEFLNACQSRRNRERRTVLLRRVSLGIAVASIAIVIFFAMAFGVRGITDWMNITVYRPLKLEWAEVPAGEFIMGSESEENELPVHTVYLDSFEIGEFEVTNEQYLQCVKAEICSLPRNAIYDLAEYSKHPVTDIDWAEAGKFCEWTDPHGYLPTEAQWEKAARGTEGFTYPWGEGIDCDHANYLECVGDTTPVGSYEEGKSPYGAYDMAGNVWEWVADWYDKDYYKTFMDHPLPNPTGAEHTLVHVQRGGSWQRHRSFARSAYREVNEVFAVGFRCARSMGDGD